MLAAGGVEQARKWESGWVSIAAENGPGRVTLSGREAELGKVEEEMKAAGVRVKRLEVKQGYHSAQMEGMAGEFAELVSSRSARRPKVALVSSVTGKRVLGGEMSEAEYWRRQVRERVEFRKAMEEMEREGCEVFLEVGPHGVLTALGQECIGKDKQLWVASLRRGRVGAQAQDRKQMLTALGTLYVAGAELDWKAVQGQAKRNTLSLPTYPFERSRYWWPEATPQAKAPAWAMLQEAARWQSNQGPIELNLTSYEARWDILARVTSAFIWNTLLELGVFEKLQSYDLASELLHACGIDLRFERLIERWLNRIEKEGAALRSHGRIAVSKPLAVIAIAPLLEQAAVAFGSDRIFLDYVLSCGNSLASILKGEKSALETLFPGGSFELAENLYQHAPLSAYIGGLGRAAMDALVRARPEGSLRILEIGAGTGSTAAVLLPVLPAGRTVYEFTDLSDVFLSHGQRKFASYPFVRYKLLNIEKPVDALHHYDVVVATNVLHATHDIRATIANVREHLAPGGLLILTEATTYLSWFDVTTALIEGWQLFDDGLRGDHPLLPADRWKSLLLEGGFESVLAFPEDGSPTEILGQHVILAQAPGEAVARIENPGEYSTQSLSQEEGSAASVVVEQLRTLSPSERHEQLVGLVRQKLAGAMRSL